MSAYNSQADAYNAAVKAGKDPGPKPVMPAPFSDPGAADREHAQQILSAARSQRDAAAQSAETTLSSATNLAPPSPSFLTQLKDDLSDGLNIYVLGQEHFAGGFVEAAAGFEALVRSVNPTDPYNILHPGEYLAGLDGLQASLVNMDLHPSATINSLLGTGWRADPFQAGGNLTFNILTMLELGGDGDPDAAPGDDIPPDAKSEALEPIDVATGEVLQTQTDVELPGVLPLVVKRTHLSSYRMGQWFGPSWASTLDIRLETGPGGVTFVAADGVRLRYPHPQAADQVAFPRSGARWPLRRTPDGGYMVAEPATGRMWVFEVHAGLGIWPLSWTGDRAGNRMLYLYGDDGRPEWIVHSGGYRVRVDTSPAGLVQGLYLASAGGETELVRYGYAGGHLTEVINSSGQPLRFTYDDDGRMTSWTDRNGVTYRYGYDDQGRAAWCAGLDGMMSGTLSYDTGRRITMVTDIHGNATSYQMDERGRVIARTDPLGHVTLSQWDEACNLTSRTDPLGNTTRYAYDEVGNLLEVRYPDGTAATAQYDQWSQPVAVTGPDGAVWRFAYDDHGNRVSQTDPAGAVTRYAYDERGGLAAVTDPLGAVTRVECDLAGLPVSVTDPAGGVTRLERDAFGRVTAVADPAGGVTRLGWTIEGKLAWRTSPSGATEVWAYDGEGNLTDYTDADGRVTRIRYSHLDLPAVHTLPDGTQLDLRYDNHMRLTAVTSAAGRTWRYDYDAAGRLAGETDFNGATIRYEHDAAGRLTARTNGAGQTVRYRRDVLGNITEQRADAGPGTGEVITTFAYDAAGRLTRAANPDAVLEYAYDAAGRVLAETCNGQTVASSYDPAGQRTARRTPALARSAWAYDAAGRPESLNAGGHTLVFEHDLAGRETRRQVGQAVVAQEWDPDHRLSAQLISAGSDALQRREYTFSPGGNVLAVADHLGGDRRFELDPAGRITAVLRGGALAERYGYDVMGNLASASFGVPAPAVAEAAGQRSYSGTLIRRAGGVSYTHDGQGRIITRRHATLSGQVRTWSYTWDADDRLTQVTTPDGHQWRYCYDPLGRRIAKLHYAPGGATPADITTFTWDGPVLAEQATELAAPSGAAGPRARVVTWDYRPGSFAPLTQAERTVPAGAVPPGAGQDAIDSQFYAIVTDLVGTPSELISPDGTLAGYQHHTLWGTTTWASGGAATPLRFPGQYEDPETGLHYNYNRYYDPATGAYLTPDPLGLAPAPNPHAYVPNPTIELDPLGLAPAEDYGTDGDDDDDDGPGPPPVAKRLPGKWLSPSEWASREIGDARNMFRNDPTETGRHDSGLRATARELGQRLRKNPGWLPEIRTQIKETIKSYGQQAKSHGHPGGPRRGGRRR